MAIKLPLPPQQGLSAELYSYLYQLSQIINMLADNIDDDVSTAQMQMVRGQTEIAQSEEEIAMRISKAEDGIRSAEAAIELSLENIEMKVDKDGVIAAINLSPENATIKADKIRLEGYTTINDGFAVDEAGKMSATDATISGKVTATEGAIGGWEIDGTKLKATGMTYLAPGQEEVDTIHNDLLGREAIPSDRIQLYDYDGNGYINVTDAVNFQSMLLGKISMADWSGAVKSEVTIEFDPSTPDALIRFSGTNMWGRVVEAYISLTEEAMGDRVVAAGETEGWHYRKWRSGTVECWGDVSVKPSSSTATGSNYCSESISVDAPFGFSGGTVTGTADNLHWLTDGTINNGNPAFRVMRSTPVAIGESLDVHLYISGQLL